MRGRIYSIILVLVMLVAVWGRGVSNNDKAPQRRAEEEGAELTQDTKDGDDASGEAAAQTGSYRKLTLRLYYTDQGMTDYLQESAMRYMAEHEDIRVLPVLRPQGDYSDEIYRASVAESQEDICDLFLTTNDTLEKAYLSGIAKEISEEKWSELTSEYCRAAENAVTYRGRKTAYPLFFETPLFFYNKTYLETMAEAHNQAMQDMAEGEAAMAQTEAMLAEGADLENAEMNTAQEQTEYAAVTGEELVPKTFEDILNLANDYDAPEGMEAILKWDVTDVFYNYFFAGAYMQMGGECGDDASAVDLYNEKTSACMEAYSGLKQFFSIEAKESDYDSILQEFIEGKTLFTIAGTDAFKKLEEARANGSLAGEYGVALLPDINESLASRSLSVTGVVAVNGFGENTDAAEDFAAYLCSKTGDILMERTDYLPAYQTAIPAERQICLTAYEKSIGLPKIMEASNFWMQLEMTLTGIWEGEDAGELMQQLQQQMVTQIEGSDKNQANF